MQSSAISSAVKGVVGQLAMPGGAPSLGDIRARVDVAETGNQLAVRVGLPLACRSIWPYLVESIESALAADAATANHAIDVNIETRVPAFGVQRNLKPLPGISNVVAVASGKGGVGKSTTAVNLALALAAEGARVGLLDADIYGPSIPRMLGLTGAQPAARDDKTIEPLVQYGLQVMSIGVLVDEAAPMVWRGPMVTSALNQLLRQTAWHELDYLIVDMPPGTGDIQLTLSQTVPVAGAVIVTTPQDVALSDARKGLEMFRKVSVPVLGIVENMSLYTCPSCGETASLFGQGGGRKLAAASGTEVLAELPLEQSIREATDAGKPSVVAAPDAAAAMAYRQLAISTGLALAASRRDYSSSFTNIVVEDS